MNERLRLAIDYLTDKRMIRNQKEFTDMIGDNPSAVSLYISGKRPISQRFMEKVCRAFPVISQDWLMTGEGEMIALEVAKRLDDPATTKYERLLIEHDILLRQVAELIKENELKTEKIGALKFQLLTKKEFENASN